MDISLLKRLTMAPGISGREGAVKDIIRAAALNVEPDIRTGSSKSQWWRRRESNPRPKAFHSSIYVRILSFYFHLICLTQAGSNQTILEDFRSQRDKHPEEAILLNFHLIPVHRHTRLDVAGLSGQCVLVIRVGVCIFSCFFARLQGPGTPLKLPYPRRILFAPILKGT